MTYLTDADLDRLAAHYETRLPGLNNAEASALVAEVRAWRARATAPRADEDATADVRACFEDASVRVVADDCAWNRTAARIDAGWRLVPPAAAPGAETTTDEDTDR